MAKLEEPDRLPLAAQQTKVRIGEDSKRFPERQCPNCSRRHFEIHQYRGRWFLLVLDSTVYPLRCLICRWLCVDCGITFTHLPAGCLPYKRYLRIEVETRAGAYIETDPMEYRRVVRDHGSDVVYAGSVTDAHSTEAEKEADEPPALAPSTVYRWIGSIAACRERYQPVVAQGQASGCGSRLSTLVVSPLKYRSEARRLILEACGLLLRAFSLIGLRNPTEFATLGSSP
jgi:hypothetical protein